MLGPLAAGCGRQAEDGLGVVRDSGVGRMRYVAAKTPRDGGSQQAAMAAAAAVAGFGVDLYSRVDSGQDNLVISPWSVAVALAMARAGARGRTGTEMDAVLHGSDLGPGLSRLEQSLHDHTGDHPDGSGRNRVVRLETASSLWGQQGIAWQRDFLEQLAAQFGAGMHTVDYKADTAGAARAINGWTADRTHDRIPHLIPDDLLDPLTRLVLVNAVWFKAPWSKTFEPGLTRHLPFRRGDGSAVQAPMMADPQSHVGYAEGPGWKAASLPYVGDELAMAVVVPQGDTRLSEVEAGLADGGLARLLGSFTEQYVDLLLPRWTFRTSASLKDVLAGLGMPTAFTGDADFSGMTGDEDLVIADVVHQGFIAVDEQGTEAAAATAEIMVAVSGIAGVSKIVHADRPFLFVVHDVATRLPLFLGRVTDPTA